jgi:carboxymethylenebutenolidase
LLGRIDRLGRGDPLEDLRRDGRLLWRHGAGSRWRAAELPGAAAFRRAGPVIPLAGVETFKAAHPEVPVFIYPAGHGFSCDHRGSYHAESARLARERALAFLRKHVG